MVCRSRSPTPYDKFDLIEVDEQIEVDEKIKSYLCKLLLTARVDPKMLSSAAKRIGWERTATLLVDPGKPKKPRKRRGDFGEILTNAILVELMGYTIPVQKLRFAISPEQSLPSTDTIAIKKANGYFSEMCFVESKLRTSNDPYSCRAAVDGYEQLKNDYFKKVPDMIRFILARLLDREDPLFDDFLKYLNNRQDLTHIDRFRLGLIWEHEKWKEEVLQSLNDETDEKSIPKMVVQRVRIKKLASQVKELFDKIGIDVITDD